MKIFTTFVIVAACIQNVFSKGIVKRETHVEECKFINVLLGKDENFDCCTVDRIECSDDGHLINIDNPEITKRDLPESIGNMPYLENLDLYGRELKGNLPQDIGTLKRIKYLRFNTNKIEGVIPESIGDLTTLEQLILNENDLEGTIPASIGKNTKLTEIQLQSNRLSGEVPTAEIEKLPLLGFIDLSNNENLYGKAPNTKELSGCYYKATKLCYAESEKNENCEYPDVHYDCAVCKDEKISTLTNGYCSCNEGYSGPAYIECTKATADNNNNNNNSNAGTNNNSSNNNNNDNSGVSSNLPSMNHLALAVLIIGILFI